MSSLAVSLLALVVAHGASSQTALSAHESQAWHRLQSSVVTILFNGEPRGTAALIDSSGLFLTHQSSLETPLVDGVLSNGRTIHLTAIAQDSVTHLVLLEAQDWKSSDGRPLRVPPGDEVGHGLVFAVLPAGPIRAAYTGLHKAGFVQALRRIIPLNEVRFEEPAEECAGALLVDEDGELLGVLGATLARPEDALSQNAFVGRARLNDGSNAPPAPGGVAGGPSAGRNGGYGQGGYAPGGGGGFGGGAVQNLLKRPQRMRPSGMTVAYTAGIVLMRRVVDGFLAPDHKVQYPSLGIFCKDTPGGGALIQSVQPNSPASRAHLEAGDILLSIGGEPIGNQVDFALVMLRQRIGSRVFIYLRRRNETVVQEAVIGKSG